MEDIPFVEDAAEVVAYQHCLRSKDNDHSYELFSLLVVSSVIAFSRQRHGTKSLLGDGKAIVTSEGLMFLNSRQFPSDPYNGQRNILPRRGFLEGELEVIVDALEKPT